MQNLSTIPKEPHSSQPWLNQRFWNEKLEKRITGSQAAAIHGEHKYTTPADYAVELLADTPLHQKNKTMRCVEAQSLKPHSWVGLEKSSTKQLSSHQSCIAMRNLAFACWQQWTDDPCQASFMNSKPITSVGRDNFP